MKTAIERHADGENGKADLLGSLKSGGKGLHAVFEMASDVLHHDDSVIDDESGRDGERHQREIVEAVTKADTSQRRCR